MSAAKIFVKGFKTKYKPDPEDASKMIGVDWVEYGQIGSVDRSLTEDRVSRLRDRLIPLAEAENNPAVAMAHARWDAIKPYYDAWKSGQEVPDSGTPIAAFNAITPEQADILRIQGVKTIESLASLTDAHIQRIPVPRLRDLVIQAQRFMESSDQRQIAAALSKKDEEIAAHKEQITEQSEQIKALMGKIDQLAAIVAAQQGDGEGEAPARGKRKAA